MTNYDLYYYRDSNDQEVDLIVDKKQTLDFIEIKYYLDNFHIINYRDYLSE